MRKYQVKFSDGIGGSFTETYEHPGSVLEGSSEPIAVSVKQFIRETLEKPGAEVRYFGFDLQTQTWEFECERVKISVKRLTETASHYAH